MSIFLLASASADAVTISLAFLTLPMCETDAPVNSTLFLWLLIGSGLLALCKSFYFLIPLAAVPAILQARVTNTAKGCILWLSWRRPSFPPRVEWAVAPFMCGAQRYLGRDTAPASAGHRPAITAARAITSDPAAQGVSLASVYSACTTRTTCCRRRPTTRSRATSTCCARIDNVCQKELVVTVDWQCPAGSSSVRSQTSTRRLASSAGPARCPRARRGLLSRAARRPHRLHIRSLLGQWICTDSSGVASLAPIRTVIDYVTVDATPEVTDTWANGCAGYEARVPPGYLPPTASTPCPWRCRR